MTVSGPCWEGPNTELLSLSLSCLSDNSPSLWISVPVRVSLGYLTSHCHNPYPYLRPDQGGVSADDGNWWGIMSTTIEQFSHRRHSGDCFTHWRREVKWDRIQDPCPAPLTHWALNCFQIRTKVHYFPMAGAELQIRNIISTLNYPRDHLIFNPSLILTRQWAYVG